MTHLQSEIAAAKKKPTLSENGYFISFEGGEGVGKSTQIDHLARHLRQEGFNVIMTREPGGTAGAEAIRHVLLNIGAKNYGPVMEAILFAAARIDHVEEVIAPALKAGKIVLCDRFIDSTRVYQGAAGKVPRGYIALLEKIAVDSIMPNLTFILDLPAKQGMARAQARRKPDDRIDLFEKDDISIQENRRQSFLKLAKTEPERCCIIDASRPVEVIAAEIAGISDQKIHQRGL